MAIFDQPRGTIPVGALRFVLSESFLAKLAPNGLISCQFAHNTKIDKATTHTLSGHALSTRAI